MLDEHTLWENRNNITFIEINKNYSDEKILQAIKIGLIFHGIGFVDLTQAVSNATCRNYYKELGVLKIHPDKTSSKQLIIDYLYYLKSKLGSAERVGDINIQYI